MNRLDTNLRSNQNMFSTKNNTQHKLLNHYHKSCEKIYKDFLNIIYDNEFINYKSRQSHVFPEDIFEILLELSGQVVPVFKL